jgi:hypothetical protein
MAQDSPLLVIAGAGSGKTASPIPNSIIVPAWHWFNMMRNLGGAVGIAVLQTLLTKRERSAFLHRHHWTTSCCATASSMVRVLGTGPTVPSGSGAQGRCSGEGDAVRSFVHIDDAVSATRFILKAISLQVCQSRWGSRTPDMIGILSLVLLAIPADGVIRLT